MVAGPVAAQECVLGRMLLDDDGLRRLRRLAPQRSPGGSGTSTCGSWKALPKFYETFPDLQTDSNLLGLTGAAQFLPGFIFPFFAALVSRRVLTRLTPARGQVWSKDPAHAVFRGHRGRGHHSGDGQQPRRVHLLPCPHGLLWGDGGDHVWHLARRDRTVRRAAGCVADHSPRYRSIASALNNCNYYIGSILSSWVTFGTLQNIPDSSWSWRLPSLLQGAVPALFFIPICLMPQSPRWLVSQGRREEAQQILAKQHANGRLDDPLVALELQEITAALEYEYAINKNRSVFSGWGEIVSTPGNRKRLFIIVHVGVGAQWNGVGIVSYYLVPVLISVGITQATPQTLVNGGLAVSGVFEAGLTGRSPT